MHDNRKKTCRADVPADKAQVPRPEPMQLAKLAAILAPNSQPAAALEMAMQFYVEAAIFARELPSEFDEWVIRFGNEKRRIAYMALPLEAAIQSNWNETLRLDPKADDDPARQFLSKHGLTLKKPRSVIDNLRRYCEERPQADFMAGVMPSADIILGRCKRMDGSKEIYEIPKFLLEIVVASAKARRGATKRKGWKSRKARQTESSV